MSETTRALAFALAARLKVDRELARWRRLGVRPRLWWRDDDARQPTAALDRLLTLAGAKPLALAVVPDGDLCALALRLSGAANVTIGQHGVDHVNRRMGGAPSEYPTPPTVKEVKARVSAGHARMLEAGLDPQFYTPPWNVVDPGLAPALALIGMPVLSAGSVQVMHADLIYASAEIDVLSWKRNAAFKGPMRVMSALRRALADRRKRGDLERPIGLLTHHLDHDEATWGFLERSMGWFDDRFAWIGVEEIAPTARLMRFPARSPSPMLAMAQPLAV